MIIFKIYYYLFILKFCFVYLIKCIKLKKIICIKCLFFFKLKKYIIIIITNLNNTLD